MTEEVDTWIKKFKEDKPILKVGPITFRKSDIRPFLQSLFICVMIVLSYVIGRMAMAYELRILLDYGCMGMYDIDVEKGEIRIKEIDVPLLEKNKDLPFWENETTTTTQP